MKLTITRSQLNYLIEQDLDVEYDPSSPSDVAKSYENKGHYKWFDHRNKEISDIPEVILLNWLKKTITHLKENYNYDLKRVFVKDNDEIVAFLIYSETNEKKEEISNDENKKINVILSTAVNPKYRNRGLLKKMIFKSNIGTPFLVHTSHISPHIVWEKFGCKPIVDRGNGNYVEICNP